MTYAAALGAQEARPLPVDSAGTRCTAGGNGGGRISPSASAILAWDYGADSAVLTGAIVARSEAGWPGHDGATRPIPPSPHKGLSGGTVDTLWLQIDATR